MRRWGCIRSALGLWRSIILLNGISFSLLIVAGHFVLLTLAGRRLRYKKKARKTSGPLFSVERGA